MPVIGSCKRAELRWPGALNASGPLHVGTYRGLVSCPSLIGDYDDRTKYGYDGV
jgi:hypothetical protein